jgi:hypothetical protein
VVEILAIALLLYNLRFPEICRLCNHLVDKDDA